jgi:hypothetical protein
LEVIFCRFLLPFIAKVLLVSDIELLAQIQNNDHCVDFVVTATITASQAVQALQINLDFQRNKQTKADPIPKFRAF